jgi:predicted O-methyltransferase YrrM
MKASSLLSMLQKGPREFTDRVLTFMENKMEKPHGSNAISSFGDEKEILERCGELAGFTQELPAMEISAHILRIRPSIPAPLSGVAHDASFSLATFCYAWCRKNRPRLVIETGVGHGVTTAFILQALAVNGSGSLWSIDLPPLGSEPFAGCFVPDSLKAKWRLHLGRTRRILPGLLREAGAIDMFLHDSLHTERNMTFEFNTAWPHLKTGGILVSDDVTFFNNAFEKFIKRQDILFSATHPAKFGVAIKGKTH